MKSSSISGGGLTCAVAWTPESGFRLAFLGPDEADDGAIRLRLEKLPASPDIVPGASLMAQRGTGYAGVGLLDAVCLPERFAVRLLPSGMRKVSDTLLVLEAADPACNIRAETSLEISDGVLTVSTCIFNEGSGNVDVHRCAAGLLPLDDWSSDVILSFGAWAREGHMSRIPIESGRIQSVSRLGRTGFDGSPAMLVCERSAGADNGRALCAHLAWSGSHSVSVERLPDGSAELCAEALYEPGEIQISTGGRFTTPKLIVAVAGNGFQELSNRLHAFARTRSRRVSRPVHFNTWEACYFDFDSDSLRKLATQAAEIGAERFVLDDGWFIGRRDDSSSLGDWEPDTERFPDGLGPLISYVHSLGMTFGLWVEPEMVSRNSALYRAHPEWVLGYPDADAPTGRNQLVLDLSNPDVQDYLFVTLSKCLDVGGIEYLKWDCNRELYPAAIDGRFCAHLHTLGVYALMDRLQARFPELEIESCASGGGRIDFGILPRVTRFWASDATDALDRIRINQALSRYVPVEMIGSHVGPSPNHITGRVFSIRFRALVAMFGHFGLELDPSALSDKDKIALADAVEVYKRFRGWMHSGRIRTLPTADKHLDVTVLESADAENVLVRVLRTGMSARPLHARIVLPELQSGSAYAVSEVAFDGGPDSMIGHFSAEALTWSGLDMDPQKPNQGRLFYLSRLEPGRS
ncbi:alpha-galactosidase [Hyphomonas johnsonii]|nr:alpha-galactosidase [Hyphomonas johnsonii]